MKILTLNMEQAIERIGDKEIYLEIAAALADHLPNYLEQLKDAFSANDSITATRVAHSLKSNCATVGADDLREQLAQLEKMTSTQEVTKAVLMFESVLPQLQLLQKTLRELH